MRTLATTESSRYSSTSGMKSEQKSSISVPQIHMSSFLSMTQICVINDKTTNCFFAPSVRREEEVELVEVDAVHAVLPGQALQDDGALVPVGRIHAAVP